MSEEEGTEQQKKQKAGNGGERAFGCPCGKTYLSYPALFTHVKQKHDGKVFPILFRPLGNSSNPKPTKQEAGPKSTLTYNLSNLGSRR